MFKSHSLLDLKSFNANFLCLREVEAVTDRDFASDSALSNSNLLPIAPLPPTGKSQLSSSPQGLGLGSDAQIRSVCPGWSSLGLSERLQAWQAHRKTEYSLLPSGHRSCQPESVSLKADLCPILLLPSGLSGMVLRHRLLSH